MELVERLPTADEYVELLRRVGWTPPAHSRRWRRDDVSVHGSTSSRRPAWRLATGDSDPAGFRAT